MDKKCASQEDAEAAAFHDTIPPDMNDMYLDEDSNQKNEVQGEDNLNIISKSNKDDYCIHVSTVYSKKKRRVRPDMKDIPYETKTASKNTKTRTLPSDTSITSTAKKPATQNKHKTSASTVTPEKKHTENEKDCVKSTGGASGKVTKAIFKASYSSAMKIAPTRAPISPRHVIYGEW